MSSSLLQLGPFSFDGLESPERIHLKSKRRLAIHHLGSGSTIADDLGEDLEIVTFRGIFSGTNASARIRQIENLSAGGLPQQLTWGSNSLSVIIHEFELDCFSDIWIPYKLSCCVVRSIDPGTEIQSDAIATSPFTQISDLLNLLQYTNMIPSSDETAALVSLAGLNFDTPPQDALSVAQQLIGSIDSQISSVDSELENTGPEIVRITNGFGQQANLNLARNRVMNVIINAEGVNQA